MSKSFQNASTKGECSQCASELHSNDGRNTAVTKAHGVTAGKGKRSRNSTGTGNKFYGNTAELRTTITGYGEIFIDIRQYTA